MLLEFIVRRRQTSSTSNFHNHQLFLNGEAAMQGTLGTAGSANDSLSIGDVRVPKYVAFTGSWNWKEFHSEEEGLPELKFGAYNLAAMGDN
ncbi:hypothetical protein RHMOL_Rhmol12G0241400 [Rhododendron molle]|uniref:Uncharacterized protein n=2 Tax=Rhododendron molle TaxID=49168 RepID=A0ACC0LMS4_RHOML|nr:hypothetical protein RHMOL_Rhmol12G0241400 [Rhododendron molle]KAI8529656.1 hypothetical protein RHMOL_Rhmol12G0241400 [Rhododendron molle]